MSAGDARHRAAPAPLTAEQERDLARKAAVAALTAVSGLRTGAEPPAGTPGTAASAGGDGGASQSGRAGRPVGFASPQRALRRPVRGSWAARG